jgi:hypothetical protein
LSFVPSDAVGAIVTDESAPADQVRAWNEHGVEVIVAEVNEEAPTNVRPIDLRRSPPERGGNGS